MGVRRCDHTAFKPSQPQPEGPDQCARLLCRVSDYHLQPWRLSPAPIGEKPKDHIPANDSRQIRITEGPALQVRSTAVAEHDATQGRNCRAISNHGSPVGLQRRSRPSTRIVRMLGNPHGYCTRPRPTPFPLHGPSFLQSAINQMQVPAGPSAGKMQPAMPLSAILRPCMTRRSAVLYSEDTARR